jgi:hypothetical protein
MYCHVYVSDSTMTVGLYIQPKYTCDYRSTNNFAVGSVQVRWSVPIRGKPSAKIGGIHVQENGCKKVSLMGDTGVPLQSPSL